MARDYTENVLPFPFYASRDARERVDQLELPFNRYGLDPFGIDKDSLARVYTLLRIFHGQYFQCQAHGTEHVPATGRAMLIGNHSGGLPIDAGMVLASMFWDMEPPRHAHGMVEYFAQKWPFVSPWFSRLGQLPGLPEHAIRFLENDRVLMVFPEGARGTGKLYKDRYTLVRFGTGFMRIALRTNSPIVPFAFIGGEEAIPTIFHWKSLAKLVGAPYIPITPYILPIPRPVKCEIHYGEPMTFEGDGNETDDVIKGFVEQVRQRIYELIDQGRESRRRRLAGDKAEEPAQSATETSA